MTQDEIIAMADKADALADEKLQTKGEHHPDWHTCRDEIFAKLVAAHKCEELAKKIEAMPFRDTAASFAKWVREQA